MDTLEFESSGAGFAELEGLLQSYGWKMGRHRAMELVRHAPEPSKERVKLVKVPVEEFLNPDIAHMELVRIRIQFLGGHLCSYYDAWEACLQAPEWIGNAPALFMVPDLGDPHFVCANLAEAGHLRGVVSEPFVPVRAGTNIVFRLPEPIA